MKRSKVTFMLFLSLAASAALGVQQRELASVNSDALTKECQGTTSENEINRKPKEGTNFVWYIPKEFWQVTLLQNKTLTQAQVDETVKALDGIFIVCVVRSKVDRVGTFDFLDERTVQDNLAVTFTDKDGKTIALQPEQDVNATTGAILGAMKPILKSAMGNMGQNMCFFVYKDTGKDGKRLVAPNGGGKLSVMLKPVAGETGGTLDFPFPLNALFIPRECTKCHAKDLNVQWQFCPHCGTALKA
jgi:hypothetical protein